MVFTPLVTDSCYKFTVRHEANDADKSGNKLRRQTVLLMGGTL